MLDSLKKGRQEDGKRSIADKIIKRLANLEKLVQHNQGRWAWELLQNAKDSIIGTDRRFVSVQLKITDSEVEFRHNGAPFTERDLRGLINQISSKETEEDEIVEKTGRFGTGFMTTHLLSKVVEVEGILLGENIYKSFSFILDRNASTTSKLIPKIDASWKAVEASLKSTQFDPRQYSTTFRYPLIDGNQKRIARVGIQEFTNLVPFVLVFVQQIKQVKIINNGITVVFERVKNTSESIFNIQKNTNQQNENIQILAFSDEKITIATKIQKVEKGYSVLPVDKIPKLFCNFPLVGTEDFHLPFIINSFYFNPLTERDGIWLNDNKGNSVNKDIQENRDLLRRSVGLYKKLLKQLEGKDFFELYNLVEGRIPVKEEKYFSLGWFKNNILDEMKSSVWERSIVEQESNIIHKANLSDIWFPKKSYDTKTREIVWKFTHDLAPKLVCKKQHLHKWCNKSWDSWKKLNFESLLKLIATHKDVEALSKRLQKTIHDTFAWLNNFFTFYNSKKLGTEKLNEYACIPNQYGDFCRLNELYLNDIQEKDLIAILQLMGDDWYALLIHESFYIEDYRVKKSEDIVSTIRTKINKQGRNEIDDNFKNAIRDLTEWLDSNENASKIFPDLYLKRSSFFMDSFEDKESLYTVAKSGKLTKIAKIINENPELIDNIEEANQLAVLWKELDDTDIESLKKMIRQGVNNSISSNLELTIERIAGLGIMEKEQLKEFLEDKGYQHFFSHESVPEIEWEQAVTKKINRAKRNVLAHLKKLEAYDCKHAQEIAKTVIGGIKKNGLPINIVIRPSESDLIIIYYESEIETLDTQDVELWVENGVDTPEEITLGRIIKANRMIKIPINEVD